MRKKMGFIQHLSKGAVILSAFLTFNVYAEKLIEPPEPLTLADALTIAGLQEDLIYEQKLNVEQARLNREYFESGNDLRIDAYAVPESANRAVNERDDYIDDSHLRLQLSYSLYDFGLTDASRELSQTQLNLAERSLEHSRLLRQLQIMEKYFNVLLADLDYGVKNEKMTIAFLVYNRWFESMEMHDAHAEVDVLELETIYREKFHIRQQAALNQIKSRRELGLAMGYQNYVPRDLVALDVGMYLDREIPEYEDLLEELSITSFELEKAELSRQKAEDARRVTIKQHGPKLEAKLEVNAWERRTGSRNDSSVGLQLKIPLLAGKSKRHAIKLAELDVQRAIAEEFVAAQQFSQQVFELWTRLRLLHAERAAAQVRLDYRDLYMDRSRTLYELEEQSDLGDAQAELLYSLFELARVEYQIALTWAKVDQLRGQEILGVIN